jgi:TonB family protein
MPRTQTLLLLTVALVACLHTPVRAQTTTPPPAAPAAQAAPNEDEVARGKRLLAQGDATGALASLKPAAERRKTDADAWYYLGLALNRADRSKDARKAFEKAAKLRPKDAGARAGIAYTLLRLGKTLDAEREAGRALALDPKSAEAHYILGVIHFRADRFEQAVAEAEEALRLKQELSAAASLAGEALLNIYSDESERAAQQYPLPPGADEAARRPVLEKRDAALESVRARLRVAAERLDSIVESQPNGSVKEELRELDETLKLYTHARSEGGAPSVFRAADLTTRAVIQFKPEPVYTEAARHHNTRGVIRLRAVLAADGRVRNILVIRRLPDGLTEMAVEAARRIRFTPATLDGHSVSQYVVLEYNFNIY